MTKNVRPPEDLATLRKSVDELIARGNEIFNRKKTLATDIPSIVREIVAGLNEHAKLYRSKVFTTEQMATSSVSNFVLKFSAQQKALSDEEFKTWLLEERANVLCWVEIVRKEVYKFMATTKA